MEARCCHVGVCGGCKFQQVPYIEQVKNKQKLIEELFAPRPVEAITPSPSPWSYRGKMEFSFSQDKKGEKYLGLVMPKSRGKVFSLTECFIGFPWMAEVVQTVRKWWQESRLEAFFPPKGIGSLRTLTMRSSRDGKEKMVILTVSGNSEYALTRDELDQFVAVAKKDENTSVFLVVQMAIKNKETEFFEMHLAGPDHLKERLGGFEFHISPRSFFQPNVNVAEIMFERAIQMLNLKGTEKVLDLYCGMGTIGILLAKHVAQVVGIEIAATSVSDARESLKRFEIKNMEVYLEDVGTFLEKRKSEFTPDIVIVDPPRTGLDKKAILAINEISPKTILYISCNPITQRENLDHFPTYQVSQIVPFDPFPHTKHIENIILLNKKESL
jgi:23S rRNA (uracil1939-C5)-methyltransferase